MPPAESTTVKVRRATPLRIAAGDLTVERPPSTRFSGMEEKIRGYLAKRLHVEIGDGPSQVPADRDLFAAGFIDSFACVELVSFLEKEFKIAISDGEALSGDLSSCAKMVSFVERK